MDFDLMITSFPKLLGATVITLKFFLNALSIKKFVPDQEDIFSGFNLVKNKIVFI